MTEQNLNEFKELDKPSIVELGNAAYHSKWYVSVSGTWQYYLRDDGNIHLAALETVGQVDNSEFPFGYFDTEEEATMARFKYYQKHDRLDLLGTDSDG